MIYFIIVWILLLSSSSVIGLASLELLKINNLRRGDRWIVSIWSGLVIMAITLTAIAFILPLSPMVGALTALSLCFCAFRLKAVRYHLRQFRSQVSWHNTFVFGTVAIAVSAYMTQQVEWIDTGLYHYGSIYWLAKFGAVPGLALLIKQFGFASSWFALSAPLNPEFLAGRASAITNGFIIFVALLHSLISLSYIQKKQAQLSDWFSVAFFLFVLPILALTHLLSIVLVSASPDIPIILLTGAIAWVILVFRRAQDQPVAQQYQGGGAAIIPLLLATGAVTIKLTALPLLFTAGLFYVFAQGWQWQQNLRRVAIASLVTLPLLAPTLGLGITTSGCPLYPSHFLCLNLPWSNTVQEAQNLAARTQGGEAWFGAPPDSVNPTWWLFLQWYQGMHSSKLIVFLILVALLVSPYILRVAMRKRQPELFWLFLFATVGILFMIWQTPLLRFGMGYLFILPALGTAMLLQAHSDRLPLWIFDIYSKRHHTLPFAPSTLVLCLVTLLAVISLGKVSEINARLLLPPALPTTDLVTKQINDVTYLQPQNRRGLCWATELPCAPHPKKNIRLLNPDRGIAGGFARSLQS